MIRLRSFRLRLALLMIFFASLALLLWGIAIFALVHRAGIRRLDREIIALMQSRQSMRPGEERWPELVTLRATMPQADALVLLVEDQAGGILHKSDNWPSGLSVDFAAFRQDGTPWDGGGSGERLPHRLAPPRLMTRATPDARWRIGVSGNDRVRVAIGLSMAGFEEEMGIIRNAFVFALIGALVLLALGASIVSHRALKPVLALTKRIESITASNLGLRLAVAETDKELRPLVQDLNSMLDRLERSFHQAERFSGDAAHELKTPLAILQGKMEQAFRQAEKDLEQQKIVADLLEETQRLKSIVEKLLFLSRADAGRLPLERRETDLTSLVETIQEDTAALAPRLHIEATLQPHIVVQADAAMLTQAIQNLASNAVKYNQPNGRIVFDLRMEKDAAILSVASTGPPIPPEKRETIFRRFARLDASRSQVIEGTGLGLSLAKEILRAHKGDLFLAPAQNGMNTFYLRLPTEPPVA